MNHNSSLTGEKKHPVITTKEARKILGKQYEELTDDQLSNLIAILHLMAKGVIEQRVPYV